MSKVVRNSILASIVILIVATGFIRDFTFVNINYAIHFLEGKSPYYYGHSSVAFLSSYSINSLYTAKWILTIVVMLIYMTYTIFTVNFLFKTRQHTRWILLLYGLLFIVGGITYVGGWIFNQSIPGYTISRVFMGFAQSPLPLMVLVPFFYLLNQDK